jgi:hypothetical protein
MAHRTVRCATGHCPVCQPRHLAVGFRPLELCLVSPPGCPVAHRTSPVDCPVCHPCVLCVTPRPIPGPAVLTPGSSLGSYIVPTNQHESFVRTLSSLMRTRENFPVGHPSQIAPSKARLTWRFFRDKLPKKKMHLVGMITLLILLSLGPGHPIPGARISHSAPLRAQARI